MADLLGQYKIIGDIAEGAFGKVKLAEHVLTGQRVALKCIRKATVNAQNPKAKTRVAREIEYLKMVNHPHIIKLYEVINTPAEVILVMEYAPGELFRYIVEHRSISEDTARHFFQQIMMAIAYLHSKGIVHRDIKPENVLLDEHDHDVKLADLGLSNEMSDGDFLRTWCGSANYAAPEVISNLPYPGPEIDVWSAGVMLYLLVCGRLPFEDEHAPTLYQKIQYGVYELPNWIPPDTHWLISRMLIVDPIKRITVPEILAHPWTRRGMKTYMLDSLQAAPSMVGTVSHLLQNRETIVDGLGAVDVGIVNELARRLHVDHREVLAALGMLDDNAVKVAYMILMDRERAGREMTPIDQKPDAAKKTQNFLALASTVIPTRAAILEPPPIDTGFTEQPEPEMNDEELNTEDEEEMLEEASIDWVETSNLELLESSLAANQAHGGGTPTTEGEPIHIDSTGRQHTLESYERSRSARRGRQGFVGSNGSGPPAMPSPPISALSSTARPVLPHVPHSQVIKPPRWNFGIRSSSPPMEVMSELYRSIKHLGAEWREKEHPWSFIALPYPPMDHDDITPATDIFFVQTRWALRGHSIRIDIQLYEVHASNYLLDFRNVGHVPLGDPMEDGGHTQSDSKYKVENPFLFLECATALIAHLAEGA